jgi:hypothetical protein
MDAIEFVNKYPEYVNDIRKVVKPELLYILDKMDEIDPHDLVRPESYFIHEPHAFGYVWSMFMGGVRHHEEKINSVLQ